MHFLGPVSPYESAEKAEQGDSLSIYFYVLRGREQPPLFPLVANEEGGHGRGLSFCARPAMCRRGMLQDFCGFALDVDGLIFFSFALPLA